MSSLTARKKKLFGLVAALPPSFVSASSGSRASGSSAVSVTAPTSISNGNWLYAFVWQNTSGAAAATISGFTQVYHNSSAAPTLTILKKMAASESGNYSVAGTTGNSLVATILNYSGGVGDVDVVGVIARTANTINTASSITATVNGTLLAAFEKLNSAISVTSGPSGMTQRGGVPNDGNNITSTLYELSPSPAGATGSKSITWATGTNGASILMQIK